MSDDEHEVTANGDEEANVEQKTSANSASKPFASSDNVVDEDALHAIFARFAAFGASRTSQSSLTSPPRASAVPAITIDNARYIKFFKDLQLTSKTLTTTDLDIIFNQCKVNKIDRKLEFPAFTLAVRTAAERKYATTGLNSQASYAKLVDEAIRQGEKGPEIHGTNPDHSNVVSRLTDSSQYTGTQKERFATIGSQSNLNNTVSNNTLNTSKTATSRKSMQSLSKEPRVIGSNTGLARSSPSTKSLVSKSQTLSPSRSAANLLGGENFKPTVPSIPKGSVFDRLTNSQGYTGRHKQAPVDLQK